MTDDSIKIASVGSLILSASIVVPGYGQIVPDGTLSTTVTTPDRQNFTITNGDRLGDNLFHSFGEFSVPTNGSAVFENGVDVENIFSRVTGGAISDLDGLIRSNGTASLFLLNPNGIIFGPNARLDVGGSFVATTARSILFAGGLEFSADAGTDPLLIINVPLGLQFGANPGEIANESVAADGSNNIAGLQVRSGNTLALVGGEILFPGGRAILEGGAIELGSVGANSTVGLNRSPSSGYTLNYDTAETFGDLSFTDAAFVAASGANGSVSIRGRNLTVTEGSQIIAATTASGSAPTLNAIASESIELGGTNGSFPSGLFAVVTSRGTSRGGDLTLETPRLTVRDGAQVQTSTRGMGDAGTLSVRAAEIELAGSSADGQTISGLLATAEVGSTGNGGNIEIEGDRLTVTGGAQVAVTTLSSGNAGTLTVRATEIDLAGERLDDDGQPISSGFFAVANSGSTGNGGSLDIDTHRLRIRDGAGVETSTFASGNGGQLSIRATESISLIGRDGNTFPTGILAVSGLEGVTTAATGLGGSISVVSPRLEIRQGAQITVSAAGSGDAGTIAIASDFVQLDTQGRIRAETANGQGGNIELRSPDIQLRRNSNISTTAGTAQAGGNGGNVAIDSELLVAVPRENSDLTANAFRGDGGRIEITASGIFGLEFRDRLTDESDITVSSTFGRQGEVQFNTPDADPASGLLPLSANPVDVTGLLGDPCSQTQSSRFIASGRGGLPPIPYEPRDSLEILEDIHPPAEWVENASVTEPALVEAQGWRRNETGQVELVAQIEDASENFTCRDNSGK